MKGRQKPPTSEEKYTPSWKLKDEGVKAELILSTYYGLTCSKER